MQCFIGQRFGQNANPFYAQAGFKGHTGEDESCGYGSIVKAAFDGFAYKVLTPEHPANDGSGFTAVFSIVDDGIEFFEWMEGHLTPSIISGAFLHKGDVIGTEANHGQIYSGNIEITLAMQKAGNQAGHHRHSQKRPIMPVMKTTSYDQYLSGQNTNPYYDGSYYKYIESNNGYNGCISPVAPLFERNLTFGASGYDVFCLQRYLAKQGYLKAEPTAFFGPATIAALAAFQKANAISPAIGFFGPVTRNTVLKNLNWKPYLGPVQ